MPAQLVHTLENNIQDAPTNFNMNSFQESEMRPYHTANDQHVPNRNTPNLNFDEGTILSVAEVPNSNVIDEEFKITTAQSDQNCGESNCNLGQNISQELFETSIGTESKDTGRLRALIVEWEENTDDFISDSSQNSNTNVSPIGEALRTEAMNYINEYEANRAESLRLLNNLNENNNQFQQYADEEVQKALAEVNTHSENLIEDAVNISTWSTVHWLLGGAVFLTGVYLLTTSIFRKITENPNNNKLVNQPSNTILQNHYLHSTNQTNGSWSCWLKNSTWRWVEQYSPIFGCLALLRLLFSRRK